MDAGAIERELDELETRIERLRGLYEQYFMGIEKLEPQIPKKDVERRIYQLRKEQIRNTALRFKFQMLIQRFNTMQQYWARVTREIENGTFRRDVMRAAARVGAKEALTILGKKRARQYAALAEAQAQKKAEGLSAMEAADEEEVELGAEDFIDDSGDDDDDLDGPPTLVDRRSRPSPLLPAPPPAPAPAPPPAPGSLGGDRSGARRRVEALVAALRTPSTQGVGDRAGRSSGLDLDFDDAAERREAPAPSGAKSSRFGELSLDFEAPSFAPPALLDEADEDGAPSGPAVEGPRPVVGDGKTQRKPAQK